MGRERQRERDGEREREREREEWREGARDFFKKAIFSIGLMSLLQIIEVYMNGHISAHTCTCTCTQHACASYMYTTYMHVTTCGKKP